MLRQSFIDQPEQEMRMGDTRRVSPSRLIHTTLKNRDTAPRRESTALIELGNRADVERHERDDIPVSERPRQWSRLTGTEAADTREVAKVTAALRERQRSRADRRRR
jgi:hypothetical protein